MTLSNADFRGDVNASKSVMDVSACAFQVVVLAASGLVRVVAPSKGSLRTPGTHLLSWTFLERSIR